MDNSIDLRFGDMVTLCIYFAVMILIGVWYSMRMKSTENYFVGARSIPGWVVGVSILGTAISSVTFLAYPGSAYETNWAKLVPGLTIPIAAAFAVIVFMPFFRRARLVTAYEYLELRFGPWARAYGCIIWSFYQFYRMGIILFLLSLPVQVMTGYDTYTIIIVLGILVTIYTVMGGIEAVIWTDVIQTFILMFGGIFCIGVVIYDMGGISPILSMAWEGGKFNLSNAEDPTSWQLNFARETIWVLLLFGLFQNLQEFASDQTKIQRYCAANSDRSARNAIWIGGLGCIPLWMMFMFVGTCMWVFYQTYPERLGIEMVTDSIFPHFILTELPVGVAGLVIAAVLAAAMSSIDSSMNGTATALTSDIYRRFIRRNKEDGHYLNIARLLSTIAGVAAILCASLVAAMIQGEWIEETTVLDVGFFLYAVLAGGLGGLFYLGFFTTRANSQGALCGIILAVLVTIWLTLGELDWLPETLDSPFHRLMIMVISNLVAFFVGALASYAFPKPPEEKLVNLTWAKTEKDFKEAE